ncbi:MAG: flagellar basal body P-ring formation chaperone FlgA [Deferribacterales bacterium]
MFKSHLFLVFWLLFCSYGFTAVYQIEGDCFNLKDIDVSLYDKNILCKLNFGEERKVSTNVIKSMLTKGEQHKIPDTQFVVVKRKGVLLNDEELKGRIISELNKIDPSVRYEIMKINIGVSIYVRDKDEFSLKIPDQPLGSVYIALDNGFKKYNIYTYIKGFKKGFIAKESIKRGELVNDNIVEAEVDITNLKEVLFDNSSIVKANQNIPKNRIITQKMVVSAPVKMKGEKVKVIYNSGVVRLETEAILLEDAYDNSIVRAKNINSGKTISGVFKNGIIYIEN